MSAPTETPEFTVELIKVPLQQDWNICKICTLNTVGKRMVNEPDMAWKKRLLASEHSPIRTLQFVIKMEIPYYVSVH